MLARKIQGVHELAEQFTGLPLQIKPDEAQELAHAVEQCAKEFNVVVSGKTAALLNLAATAAMIYTPKIIMIYAAIRMAQMQAASENATNITPAEMAAAGSPIPEAADAGAVAAGTAIHPAAMNGQAPVTSAAKLPPTTTPAVKGRAQLG